MSATVVRWKLIRCALPLDRSTETAPAQASNDLAQVGVDAIIPRSRRGARAAEWAGFENRPSDPASPRPAGVSGQVAGALSPALSPSGLGETNSHAALDAARKLLELALTSPAPAPLLAGARALLEANAAKGDSAAKLARDLLDAAAGLADPAPVLRGTLGVLDPERASSMLAGA